MWLQISLGWSDFSLKIITKSKTRESNLALVLEVWTWEDGSSEGDGKTLRQGSQCLGVSGSQQEIPRQRKETQWRNWVGPHWRSGRWLSQRGHSSPNLTAAVRSPGLTRWKENQLLQVYPDLCVCAVTFVYTRTHTVWQQWKPHNEVASNQLKPLV